ncbi:hypothetical protein TELCIR_18008 [Teladorsagia circumcincta]|uniref:G-protein coupled receptors family 1 profile domain-containing protein n=1 Tax=Teladorsagia circumcincta TaxID=45464 RepID=A0A2G9TR80_TELCI|nr:hypothetical protein TELCIR_18008 [Teladorsagia circumcincta]
MHVFYFNIPWIINETEYNCSGRTLSEWKSRGSVNEVQGLYYAVTGIFFVALYVVCLIGMYRGKLLKTPCYRFMFFNGFIDIIDLFSSSLFPAYFHLTGSVFCSSPAFNWFAGYLSWCVWSGASFNCAVLALNRVVEMIPSAKLLRFLFKGHSVRIWMALSVAYMVVLPFITRTHPFSSVISTYMPSPMITDDPAKGYTALSIFASTKAYAVKCWGCSAESLRCNP